MTMCLFFHQEMKYRQVAKYPPYCHMVSILIQSKQEKWIHQVAMDVKNYLQTHSHQTIILGPAKSTIYKMQDIYRERILVKFLNSKDIYEALIISMIIIINNKRKGENCHVI